MKPHVDISTGKIYGCKKGSFHWWHEKGHIEFNNRPETSWMLMYKSYLFDVWMLLVTIALVYNPAHAVVVVLWLTYFFFTIYEEHWCNLYAKKKIKVNK